MRHKGFTIIEMIVVCTIFSIIIGAVIGIFISAIRAQRYSLASQQLTDQASYTTEYMSRFLRMAKRDDDGDCITAGTNYYPEGIGDQIEFKNYHKECQKFYLSNGQIYQYRKGFPDLALTSDKFKVTNLQFNISGNSSLDTAQPRVTIFLEMEGKGSPKPRIKIQTTISQRDLDIPE